MTGDKIFLDTNVFVYAYDVSAGIKHKKAQEIIVALWDSGNGVLSTQVLQEFFMIVTKKIPNLLDPMIVKQIISDFLKWNVVVNNGETILKSIELHRKHYYSFWDSMIIQSAIDGNADILFSEDFADDKTIEGVKIKNPFK